MRRVLAVLALDMGGRGHDATDRSTGGAAAGTGTDAVIRSVGRLCRPGHCGGVGAASGAAVPEQHLNLWPASVERQNPIGPVKRVGW